jgi:hypothetical protein
VTIDLFFDSREAFDRYHDDPAIQPPSVAAIYGVDPALVALYKVPDLNMVKISYPRPAPQGGVVERDMHSGQQFVFLLDVEMS